MILIVSDPFEISTSLVIKWLRHYNLKYIRINHGDLITIKNVSINDSTCELEFMINSGPVINTNEITSYWYRRGDFSFQEPYSFKNAIKDQLLKNTLIYNLQEEQMTIKDFMYFIIESKAKNLGNFSTKVNNKLIHLSIAKSLKIEIPDTIICTNKTELNKFKEKHSNGIIVKAVGDSFTYTIPQKVTFASYTNIIESDDLDKFPETFSPTLFQNKIDKKVELRIFYINGKCFAMGIFSQKDDKTKIDFRRYNRENMNQRVPFELPAIIKNKLVSFMKKVNLNTGSIDMIYTNDGRYVFLEVNPVGQFGMVSVPCNYYLERTIAQELSLK